MEFLTVLGKTVLLRSYVFVLLAYLPVTGLLWLKLAERSPLKT